MSEIDVCKCEFNSLNRCKSPINKHDIECDKVPIEKCYYKQLQQLKQENEKIKLELDFAKHLEQHAYNKAEQKLEKIHNFIKTDICEGCAELEINKHSCSECNMQIIKDIIK